MVNDLQKIPLPSSQLDKEKIFSKQKVAHLFSTFNQIFNDHEIEISGKDKVKMKAQFTEMEKRLTGSIELIEKLTHGDNLDRMFLPKMIIRP